MDITIEKGIQELKAPLKNTFNGNEAEFEDCVLLNIHQINEALSLPPIQSVKSQARIDADGFRIVPDILLEHEDGTATVIEVKKTSEKHPATGPHNQMAAIGQLLLYGNVLGELYKRVRLALIDNKIYYRTFCAFIGYKLPITLIDFQKDRLFIPYFGWDGETRETEKGQC